MKYLPTVLFLLIVSVCDGSTVQQEKRKQESIQNLENRGFDLLAGHDEIFGIESKDIIVRAIDVKRICTLPNISVMFFYNSVLQQGVIPGLKNCNKLMRITYSDGSSLLSEEIPEHNAIPALEKITFIGPDYGDEIMPYLARLSNVKTLSIGGQPGVRGGVTNDGIRRFAEARTSDKELHLVLSFNSGIDDGVFPYLLKLKGLTYVDFGTGTNVSRKGVNQFYVDYYKKHKVMLNLVHGL